MIDSEQLRKRAEQLCKDHPYFKIAPKFAWVAGWLRYGSGCVYCGKPLMADWETLDSNANTDHLLPKDKYEQIDSDDSNLVLGCRTCNGLKRNYDANLDLPERLRYVRGESLSDEQHKEILTLCRMYVSKRRAERRAFLEGAISCWTKLLPPRADGPGN